MSSSTLKSASVQHKPGSKQVQTKLQVNEPGDVYEQEADAMADSVMQMQPLNENASAKPVTGLIGRSVQRKCAHCEEEEKRKKLMRKESGGADGTTVSSSFESALQASKGSGSPLPASTRNFMERAFSSDFSNVKIHTGNKAAEMNQSVNAKAFTYGNDIYFNEGQYSPNSYSGKHLLAHELTHTVQQSRSSIQTKKIQRATLTSPRLIGNPLFLDVINNRAVIEMGDSGSEVRRIQQLLIDLGFSFPTSGANGIFNSETEDAVKAFQRSRTPPLVDDGRVGFRTIGALDSAFPAFTLPANRKSPWSMSCVLDILCPWNKHLVTSVLPTFNIITFTSRKFPTEKWDGSKWVPGTFISGGFRQGKNMGFLNSTSCQDMAFTIYHEGWHAQQPSGLTGVVDTEKDAYINAEQWAINMGLPGQGNFTNKVTGGRESFRQTVAGETVVNETSAETFVRQKYGGVSAVPGERLLKRVGAVQVQVRRANGTTYIRNANPGESVRGPVSMPGQATISPSSWVCP